MFVIPRAEGESIVIGDEIVVTVVEVQGEHVRLSIEELPGRTSSSMEATDVVLQVQQTKKLPR
jgi:carbon storage regulator CsrA